MNTHEYLRQQLYAGIYKKRLSTKLILPMMSLATVLFILAFYDGTTAENFVLGLVFVNTLVNIYLSSKSRTFKLGSVEINSRSESVDAARWLFNLLVVDPSLFYNFHPSLGGLVLGWLALLISAQADLYSRRFRNLIVIVGYFAAATMIFTLYPEASKLELKFVTFVLGAMLIVFNVGDTFWVSEIDKRLASEEAEKKIIAESERLRFDALLGEKLKFIMHEVNNLLFVLEAVTNSKNPDERKQLFTKTYSKLKGIAELVLNPETGSSNIRNVSFGSVLDDLETIVLRSFRTAQIDVKTNITDAAFNFQLRETNGSLFYILFNIAKNAKDALDSVSPERRSVSISASVLPSGLLTILVRDSGLGMSASQIDSLLEGAGVTTKSHGHGIGMRFVRLECSKNNFQLAVTASDSTGTEFSITIPPLDISYPEIDSSKVA